MLNELAKARHAKERGTVLKVLQAEYSGRMTLAADLLGAVDLLGRTMTPDALQFHLRYLADEEYVKVMTAVEAGQARMDRTSIVDRSSIVMAKITPRGIRLIDGDEPANAGITF